jgi:hypothetical protein
MEPRIPDWITSVTLALLCVGLSACGSSSDDPTTTAPNPSTVVAGAGDITPRVE